MNRVLIAGVALLLGAALLQGLPDVRADEPRDPTCEVTVEIPTTPVFLGVTPASYALNAGYPAMNAACDAAFPDSRMCTEEMVLATFPAPSPGTDALVQTSVRAAYFNSSSGDPVLYGAAGLRMTDGGSPNCSTGFSGLFSNQSSTARVQVLTASGDMEVRLCNSGDVAVACCGLP